MILGIGTDLCSISRVEKILNREGEDGAFFRRTFTEAERMEASARHDRAQFYAARFAVKEAVAKALRCRTDLREIESLHREDGSPYVRLSENLQKLGVSRLHLSITHEGDSALAFVVAEKDSE